ncbi:MAG: thermonuclease family protein [Candidatus Campbellbacteria bacterium]|nr:thermonuclease family protein [Candidatus Campbellbacteria bacterium]
MKRIAIGTLLVFGLLLLSGFLNLRQEETPNIAVDNSEVGGETAVVTSIIDGDTIRVTASGGDKETVRLIGVDTPEIYWEEMISDCYGFEAREFLVEVLKDKTVRLVGDESQPTYDKYDRLLSYVYLLDGKDHEMINLVLLRGGYARELTVGNSYEHRQDFLKSEAFARENDIGQWSECES